MKIHELNNGDLFSAEIYNPLTNEIELTITGEFIKMDGAYARVKLWGNDDIMLFHCGMEVRRLKND